MNTMTNFDYKETLVLYSFRRCPYAIRGRMSLYKAGFIIELREVDLKNKPEQMLKASPKGTVPVLILPKGKVIDESLDIMKWALNKNDPDGWLNTDKTKMQFLIERNDNKFKRALDRYKYPNRYPNENCKGARETCTEILNDLNNRLKKHKNILSNTVSMADIALLPFIRQCALVDTEWFYNLHMPRLHDWLQRHLDSTIFKSIMIKSTVWTRGGKSTLIIPEH